MPQQASPALLAAGQYPQPTSEAVKRPYWLKKGKGAQLSLIGSLQDLQEPQPTWDWEKYQKTMGTGLSRVADIMGLLFEIEVFLFLIQSHGLDTHSSISQFESDKQAYINMMSEKKPDQEAVRMIVFTVEKHAKDLALKMLQRSNQILKCQPDFAVFSGGPTVRGLSRPNPSDIILVCSQVEKELGWSLKFTGETRVSMTDVSPTTAYKMLGGRRDKGFEKAFKKGIEKWEKYGDYDFFLEEIIPYFRHAAEKNFGNPSTAPKKFASLINKVIANDYQTMLGVRNYASVARGGVDWSGAIEKDFITNGKLKAKPNAVVTVETEKSQVKLTYKLKGGSQHGTKIFFAPKNKDIKIKVTNLTSNR
jgi:hypothetical protein